MMFDISTHLSNLVAEVPVATLEKDTVTVVHLVAMAVALGSVLTHDFMVLRHARRPVMHELIRSLHNVHRLIAWTLLALWISGVALIGFKTGFVWSEFSPKLITKVLTVSVLTVTAFVMGRVGLPLMEESVGMPLLSIPFKRKLALAACGGMSFGGWMTAVTLGGAAFLKTAAMGPVLSLAVVMQMGSLAAALTVAVAGHVFVLTIVLNHLVRMAEYDRAVAYVPAH